jgi:hypothetical protein
MANDDQGHIVIRKPIHHGQQAFLQLFIGKIPRVVSLVAVAIALTQKSRTRS